LSDSSAHSKYTHSRRNKQRLIKSIEKAAQAREVRDRCNRAAWAGGGRFFSCEEFISEFHKRRKGGDMKLQRVGLVLMGMMLLFAGRSSAQQVKTDYDRNANFGQYKTYSWEQIKTQDPLMVDRIKSAVNAALAAKDFTEVASGGDLSIVAMETTQNQQTLDTFYNNFGGGWRWGGFGDATTTTENYKVGTLVVDLFDTTTKKLVWRGSASDTLSNKSEKNIDNLDKGVEKLLKKFPPDASKK
jgi:hypothetical protein